MNTDTDGSPMGGTVKVRLGEDLHVEGALSWWPPEDLRFPDATYGGIYDIPVAQHERWERAMGEWERMQDEIATLIDDRTRHKYGRTPVLELLVGDEDPREAR